MPSSCFVVGTGGVCLTSIGIIGGNLRALSAAHTILDCLSGADLHLIEESAEIGLIGEAPGILTSWPVAPPNWVSDLGHQEPTMESTAIRRSWLEKAMATALAARGCTLHLRTRVLSITSGTNISFVGAGFLGSGEMKFDNLLDMRSSESAQPKWKGGVCLHAHAPPNEISGHRPDGTVETWWQGNAPPQTTWVQRMSWNGDNPKTSLEDDIRAGSEAADNLVDTIIQTPPRQSVGTP